MKFKALGLGLLLASVFASVPVSAKTTESKSHESGLFSPLQKGNKVNEAQGYGLKSMVQSVTFHEIDRKDRNQYSATPAQPVKGWGKEKDWQSGEHGKPEHSAKPSERSRWKRGGGVSPC